MVIEDVPVSIFANTFKFIYSTSYPVKSNYSIEEITNKLESNENNLFLHTNSSINYSDTVLHTF